ncbi:hypothetical protein ACFLYO_11930 [Chloroflexota bacterium]
MPVTLEWFNPEKTILLEDFYGTVTIEEYHQMVDEAAALLKERAIVIHIIADFSKTTLSQLPTNLLAAQRYADLHLPPNQGIVAFVKPGLMIAEVIRIGKRLRLASTRYVFLATSREEAQAIIASNAHLFEEQAVSG